MVKHGPCHHCGATSTPLWRNGPPEKPVLCNACGSRWRTKGSLANYFPMHSRDFDPEEAKTPPKPKTLIFKHKEQKSHKKKQSHGGMEFECERQVACTDQNFRKILEEDTSNRSSSGSAISCSESSAYLGYTEASDLIGSSQSNVWESLVPSKKRSSCSIRPKRHSSVEKLTRELQSIYQEEQSHFSEFSEVLLYECETPAGSFEIGNGSFLIRTPKTVEEGSEASSLPVVNKTCDGNKHFHGSASASVHSESKGESSLTANTEQCRKIALEVEQDHIKRDKISHTKHNILQDRNSPLCSMDLSDIVSYEEFMNHLTHEEQNQLFKLLPPVDIAKPPESLNDMFNSMQFRENLYYFQMLLLDGVFDLSFLKSNFEGCRALRKLVLVNMNRAKWMVTYCQLKEAKLKNIGVETETLSRLNSLDIPKLTSSKRPRDSQHQGFSDAKRSVRSRVAESKDMSPPSERLPRLSDNEVAKAFQTVDNFTYNVEGFGPGSLGLPPKRGVVPASFQVPTDSSTDQDVLLDPDAGLLCHRPAVPICSVAEDLISGGEESLSNFPSCSSTREW